MLLDGSARFEPEQSNETVQRGEGDPRSVSRPVGVEILARVESLSETDGVQIASLSILSHGSGGEFDLGTDTVSNDMSAEQTEAWQSLADNFTEEGNLYLYGCNVVDGTGDGQALLDSLASSTGTDVRGSVLCAVSPDYS